MRVDTLGNFIAQTDITFVDTLGWIMISKTDITFVDTPGYFSIAQTDIIR